MPLRDHFHSPVRHRWDAVYGMSPMMIVRQLYDILPEGFESAPTVKRGVSSSSTGRTGVAPAVAPSPTLTLEADLSEFDEYEVRIYDAEFDRQLVAAIELVSPRNKDRPESRRAFVAKVQTLLRQDVCVSIVDLVTNRQANFYAELLESIDRHDPVLGPDPSAIYAVTIRSRNGKRKPALVDVWYYPMAVGASLPTLPIWLAPDRHVLLPLEAGYEETCRLLHIA
jgi:hypothetical protein